MSMTYAEIYTNTYFIVYVLVQFACWVLLIQLFKGAHLFNKNPLDTANKFVNLGSFCWLAFYGSWIWFFDSGFAEAYAENKILGDYGPARTLFHAIIGHMIFDTTNLIIARAAPEFFAHHICVLFLANLALTYGGPEGEPAGLYYGVFFFGVVELSSIPLSVVDMMRGNKDIATAFPKVNDNIRYVFAASFFCVRIVYWPFVIIDFYVTLIPQAIAGEFPVGITVIASLIGVGLTTLQFFWGFLIVKGALKARGGGKNEAEDAITERKGSIASLVG